MDKIEGWDSHVPDQDVTYRFLGISPRIEALRSAIAKVAHAHAPVLVTGEIGTGKELVARLIHGRSGRAVGPFVAISGAAVAPSFFEPAANSTGSGRPPVSALDIDAASGGTLFIQWAIFLRKHRRPCCFTCNGGTATIANRRFGSCLRPMRTLSAAAMPANFAKTSTTGLPVCAWMFPRSASAARISPCWPGISWMSSRARASCGSTTTPSASSPRTPGPEMSGNSGTAYCRLR
jgi:Sigma-54 interaction domain